MGDAAKKKSLSDFHGDLDAYISYKVDELADAVHEVAKRNGCTPQQALDAMFKASVQHARTLKRNRLAQNN